MSSDQIFQEFKLYIEGVQVPFVNMSINQGYGTLPVASITIPPQGGLMDISRFYQPKVLIVYTERVTGIDRILFTGIITNPNYSKSRSGNGNVNISFECKHRYFLITECLVDYSGFIRENDIGGPGQSYTDQMNSLDAVVASLNGITSVSKDGTTDIPAMSAAATNKEIVATDVLPFFLAPYANRLVGMPGVIINFWNQLNRAAFNKNLKVVQGSFIHVYKPLIEQGLQFFQRMAGHMVIEKQLNQDREETCTDSKTNKNAKILVPPCYKLFLKSAIQSNLAVNSLHSHLQNSNELTNLYEIFTTYFVSMEYEINTLASPAEVLVDPDNLDGSNTTYAVDTIIKPSMPFYYSPACNVLYPSMYTDISVSYDDDHMPTRLDVKNNATQGATNTDIHYRAPASIRAAIAGKSSPASPSLSGTTASSYGAVGLYEMGRGIKQEILSMPNWVASMISSTGKDVQNTFSAPASGTPEAIALAQLQGGWNTRFPDQANLNPWDPASNINPYERLLFSTSDYYFTKKFASTKAGRVSGPFNPYIVSGYPMDIIEATPYLPSFHAMCSSITHNITASSVSTEINFIAATTYAELANYYLPFVNPYLQVALGLAFNPTLVNTDSNAVALSKANDYYKQVLGVNAVLPEMVYDFSNGMAKSVKMSTGGNIVDSGVPLSNHSFEEDLSTLCKRPIETKDSFCNRSGLDLIDMTPYNYTSTGVKWVDPIPTKFEIGQNQFLDYSTDKLNIINKPTA